MIKAVTFDLGNTLLRQDNIDWKKLEKAGFLNHINIFSKQNLTHPSLKEWSGMYERIAGHFSKIANRYHMEIPAEKIFQTLREFFNIPSAINTQTLLTTFFVPLMNARLLTEHALDVLKNLSDREIPCGVISNTLVPGVLAREVLERLEIARYFHFTLFSSDFLFSKPHPMMFEIALARFNVKPSQVLHVGDQIDKDVAGARSVGMRTVWINRERKKRKKKNAPDFEIYSLDELPILLKKIK